MSEQTTWLELYELMSRAGGEGHDNLLDTLEMLLSKPDWHRHPEKTGLFEFLALCWPTTQLRNKIHEAMGELPWIKDRRETFLLCIQEKLPAEILNQSKNGPVPIPVPARGKKSLKVSMEGLELQGSKDKPSENYANYVEILTKHEHWKERLRLDLFGYDVMIDERSFENDDVDRIATWCAQLFGFPGDKSTSIKRAAVHVASENRHDSLLDFISGLEWDGHRRLDEWMAAYCGAKAGPYATFVGRTLILQMVVRALDPGSIARYVVVLEGEENTGKSELVRRLGMPWSYTMDMSLDTKEAHIAIRKVWIAELAELETLYRTRETRLKSFLTQRKDSYVPKYLSFLDSYKRRTIFIGTTNENQYLVGQTGNTRFLPIETGVFDLPGFDRVRDQLFAEARDWLRKNPDNRWWVPNGSVALQVSDERESRRQIYIFEDLITRYVNGDVEGDHNKNVQPTDNITLDEIYEKALGITDRSKWSQKERLKMTTVLSRLGFRSGRKKVNGKMRRCWIRPGKSIDDIS